MANFSIIRPGGVTTPGSTPIEIIPTLPTGAAPPVTPPPSAADAPPGQFTSTDYASTLAETTRTPIYQIVIKRLPTTGPSGYWTLDEGLGEIRQDSAGSNDLASFNVAVGQATGHIATAAQFNSATPQYLGITYPGKAIRHEGGSFSVTCWGLLDSKAADMAIVGQYGATAPTRSWRLQYRQGTDRFRFVVDDGAGGTSTVSADTFGSPSTGVFYFIEATYVRLPDVNDAILYISVNGLRDTSGNIGSGAKPSVITSPFEVGANGSTDYFNGRIDDLRFFKYAISDEERTALLNDQSSVGTQYEFCTSHPSNRDPIGDELLIPMTLEQRADIEQCRFPLSAFICALVDRDGIVRAAVTDGLAGCTIDFYLGFWELPWEANKRLKFHGIITEIEQHAGIFQLTSRSPMAVANDAQVFDGAQTRLTAAVTDIATTFNVASTTAFSDPSADINHTYPLLTDNEFSFALGRTATTFTNIQRVGSVGYAIPPDMPDSESVAHVVGTIVREMVELGQLTGSNSDSGVNDLHPMDLLRDFIEGDKEKASLGSQLVVVNDAELDAAKTTLGTGLKFKFLLDEAINAKAFAEKELYLAVAGYPRENAAGELGIKLYQDAADVTIVGTIADKDIIVWPHWLRNAEKIVNFVTVRYDYQPLTKDYTSTFEYRDESLISLYGERPLIIESKGIRSQYDQTVPVALTWFGDTLDFLLDMTQRQVARFGGRAPVFSVTTVLTKQLLNIGDVVEVSFSQVPDIDTGELGVTYKKCEIAAMKHDYISNTIEFELLAYPAE